MSGLNNVISWADAVEALKVIAEEQKLVSGMSVPEAATALKYTVSSGGMYLKTVMSTVAPSVAGATATEVAAVTATGAATTTAVNLTLVEGVGGTATVAGIGTIALPIAACLGGAFGGYLIGKELNKNEAYSDFFDKLVYGTCDFVTGRHLSDELYNEENAPTVPLLFDVNGNAYLPSGMLSSVKNYLDAFSGDVPSIGTYDWIVNNMGWEPARIINTTQANKDAIAVFLQKPILMLITVTYSDARGTNLRGVSYNSSLLDNYVLAFSDGAVCIYTKTGVLSNNNLINAIDFGPSYYLNKAEIQVISATSNRFNLSLSKIAFSKGFTIYSSITDYLAGGAPIILPGGILPEPITKYTPAPSSITPIVTPNGLSWNLVTLPSTSPTEMPDGEPSTDVPHPERLTPYIPPFQPQPAGVPVVIPATTPVNPIVIPNPEPDVSTVPYPKPNPALDPSQLAEPLPVSEPVEPLPNPVNTGNPTLPLVPSVPAPSSAKGLLHVYNPTPTQVDQFGEWLWTTFSGDLIDTIGKLFNNPMDAVIGLHELYCTPITTANSVNIRAGFLESNVASRLVSSRYKEIQCGAVSVPECWGNYLDYSPYTKSYCYLPFIGIVELNTDDIVGSGVEITYRIDTYNGSCIAIITTAKPNSAESVTYQFEGNCSVSVPITSGMMSALQNGLMGIATTAISAAATAAITVATGGTALPAAVLMGSVAAGATNQALTSKNMVQHSGSFGSSFGAMGIKIPFLIIKRPRQKVVHGYNTNYGYPAHKMVLLSSCSGYLKAKEVDVISPTATEAEKKMIEQSLKSGIFVD